ncbi:hypothetical protein SCLCIDRAFT_108833 [Scleroderma citrinum Foug A]|uniref:Uncharacterized protein n=1 Tax=Scleroderma citrinum Foug A TaxID=1036808 RepID=A0A0C3A0F7_9AGAM|nr:hypothetical protein SCLCIDRAFT_108833 [Scleroderma citrinum Foug A]
MQQAHSPIPFICISPASPKKTRTVFHSPLPDDDPEVDDSGFRAKHLTPPPNMSPRYPPPLRSSTYPIPKGLHHDQFDQLLKASRERRATLGAQKAPDLRKELAVKNQKNKQLERRALFLSKLSEPPSPTATVTPKTPPESPAILHCCLPSPGLESPLAVFESVTKDACDAPAGRAQGWVEQIDFRLPISIQSRSAGETQNAGSKRPGTARKFLPSLDEITARMGSAVPGRSGRRQNSVLPPSSQETTSKARPKLNVGRLHIPLRTLSFGASISNGRECNITPPPTPHTPKLEVTTTVVPRTASATPFPLNESNLRAFSRLHTARDMMKTLKRRSLPPPPGAWLDSSSTSVQQKRKSAPVVFYGKGRAGFEHDVLSIPGGF